MSELFDMIAGSETGAIIGATLVLKNEAGNYTQQKNKYFADRAVQFFLDHGDSLYMD